MKHIIIPCLLLTLMFGLNSTSSAQSFQEGNTVLNAGIGIGSTYSWSGLSLPLGAGFEYGVSDLETGTIGVGGDIGFVSGGNLTIFYLGAKGTYHFNELFEVENEDLDIYGGLGLYYRNFSFSGTGNTFASGLYAGFHAGTRYYVSDNFGIYGELGNNWGWLNIGVVYKL